MEIFEWNVEELFYGSGSITKINDSGVGDEEELEEYEDEVFSESSEDSEAAAVTYNEIRR